MMAKAAEKAPKSKPIRKSAVARDTTRDPHRHRAHH